MFKQKTILVTILLLIVLIIGCCMYKNNNKMFENFQNTSFQQEPSANSFSCASLDGNESECLSTGICKYGGGPNSNWCDSISTNSESIVSSGGMNVPGSSTSNVSCPSFDGNESECLSTGVCTYGGGPESQWCDPLPNNMSSQGGSGDYYNQGSYYPSDSQYQSSEPSMGSMKKCDCSQFYSSPNDQYTDDSEKCPQKHCEWVSFDTNMGVCKDKTKKLECSEVYNEFACGNPYFNTEHCVYYDYMCKDKDPNKGPCYEIQDMNTCNSRDNCQYQSDGYSYGMGVCNKKEPKCNTDIRYRTDEQHQAYLNQSDKYTTSDAPCSSYTSLADCPSGPNDKCVLLDNKCKDKSEIVSIVNCTEFTNKASCPTADNTCSWINNQCVMPPISPENAAIIAETPVPVPNTVTPEVVIPTTPVVATSITEPVQTTTAIKDPSVNNNERNTDNCKFIPKGFTQHGCVRLCMNESDVNGCSYEDCDTKCHLCEDSINCRWLLDSELFLRNNKGCEFNATHSPFKLGETEKECVDACRNNRLDFGGDNCSVNACRESCNECEDPIKCPWTIKKTIPADSITAPSQPIISGLPGNQKITISWKRPFSGNSPITKYVIMAFKSNDHNSGLTVEVIENNLVLRGDTYTYTINNLTNNIYYTIGIAALNARGMSKMSNSVELKPYAVDTVDQITTANQIEADARMRIKKNSELTKSIIRQMILNKEKITETMLDDINYKLEQEQVAKSMGEAPVHSALSFFNDKDLNIEISS